MPLTKKFHVWRLFGGFVMQGHIWVKAATMKKAKKQEEKRSKSNANKTYVFKPNRLMYKVKKAKHGGKQHSLFYS